MKPESRVEVWNSYFCVAYEFAKKLKNGDEPKCPILEGGLLPPEKHYALMTVLHLALAIEARSNHLLHELKEEEVINKKLRDAVRNVRAEYKWAILPLLKKKEKINFDRKPHNAILEICLLRNNLIHLSYNDEKFIEKIPNKNKTLQLFNSFIDAREDLDVILGRVEPGREYLEKIKL
jgi:hypothetical protein